VYVRPLVELFKSPHLKQDIEAVEGVQRRFIPGFKTVSCAERLKRLNLPILELRRLLVVVL